MSSILTVGVGLLDLSYEQQKFSEATFGPASHRGPVGPLKHLAKEAKEAYETWEDTGHPDLEERERNFLKEMADCLILLNDARWRSGLTWEEIIQAARDKVKENLTREWPDWRQADPNSAIEHVRG